MRGLLAVARREIEEKRFVFLAAAAASLVPFAVPIVRGLHGTAAVEIREWIALVGASTLAVGLAALLGATVIASDLAERRLGFYFSRPITGFALWGGKLGAAGFIALAAAAIFYIPTLAINGRHVEPVDLPEGWPGILAAVALGAVLLFHAGNIVLRQRSPLLALDVAMLVLLVLGAIALLRRLDLTYALEPPRNAATALIAAAAIALLLAGLLAVTRGRSDGRAAHRVLSATLWSILGAGFAATAFYSAWVFSIAPKDLTRVNSVTPASKGSWISVQAIVRGWRPNFLYDTATGRYRRVGASWIEPVMSPDGTRAAWFEASIQGGPYDVFTWKLDETGAKPVRALSLPSIPYTTFLSDHGERLAMISYGVLSVWDTLTGASLGSVRVAGESPYLGGFFLDRNRVRILRFKNRSDSPEENSLDILEFDLSARSLSTIVTLDDASACIQDETGDRLLVRGKSRLTLRDAHTGALIAVLSERVPTRQAVGHFLSGGRIAVSVAEGPAASGVEMRSRTVRVDVFTRDGQLERSIPIPAGQQIRLGGEVAPGQLVVGAGYDPESTISHEIYLANLSTGQVRLVAKRLGPLRNLSEPGSDATKIFFGPDGSLVHFDALTGERRIIIGKAEPR
jgi:hypothetical protein